MGSGAKPKSKRRNSDKRKEKSRDAARTRRSKESEIFNNLLKEIPVSMGILSQLDKASVIRLAITHLKLRAFFQSIFDGKDIMCTFPSAELESKLNKLYYKAINGFIMIITNTGNLVYITESINQHLGLSQIDMLGQNILDFIHPCDHDEMKDIWSSKNTTTTTNDNNNNNNNNTTNNNTNNILSSNMITTMEPSSSTPCLTTALNADTTVSKRMKLTSKKNILSASSSTMSLSTDNLTNNEHLKKMKKDFFVRMKSVQFSKSRSTSHKSSSYRVIHCSGYLISTHSSSAPSSTPSLKFPPNSSLSLPASPSSSLSSPSSPSLLNYSVPSSSKHLQQPQHVKQQLLQQQQQQHPNSKDNVSYLVLECDTILQPLNSSSNNNPNAINSSSNNSAVNSTGNINGSNNNNNIKLDCHSFITHHTMDMKFIYCDDNIKHLLGYSPDELVGTSLYEYHHVHDSSLVFNAFKTLFTKGQMISGLYRFLARHGGYAWVETQASLVRNPQTDRPQSVICISSVVSGIVHEDSILSFLQQRQPCKLPKQKIISICSPSETALNLIQRRSNVASLLKVEKRDDENVAMVVEKQSSTLSPSSAKIDCTVNNASASKVEDVEFKNKKNVGENLMVFNNYNNANHKLMSDRNNLNDNINISCNNNNNNNDADDVVIESMDDVDVSPVNYSIINHSSLEIMGEIEIGNDGFVTNDNSSNSNNDNGSNSNDNDSDDVDVNDYDCFRKSFNDHHHHHEVSHHYNEDYDKNNDGKINDNDIDVMFATEIILSNIKNAMQKSENNEGHNDQHFNMDDTKLPSHMSSTLPCISSTASLYKLLNELEDEEDELRAPFIPLDDLIFANDPSISNDVNNKNILNNNDNNILVINAGDITPSMRPLFYINDNINAANEGTAKVAQVQQNFKNIPIAVIVNKETAQLISTDKLLQNTSHQSQPHHHQQQQHQQQQQQHQQQQHQQQQQQQHNQQQQLNLDINNCFNTSKYLVLSKFKNNADHQIMNNSNNNNNNDLNYKCQQHQPLHDLNYKQQHQQQQQQQQHQLQQQQQLQNHDPLSTSSSSTFNPIQFLTCQSNNNNNQQHSNNTAQQINYLFNKIDGLNDHATNNKINGHNCNNNMSSSSSVLKNLLLKGEDTNYGYRLKVDVLRPPYQQHELQQQHQHELQQQHQQEQQYQQQQQQQQQQHELQHSPNNVDVRSFDKSQPLTATQTSSAAETVDTITTYHHHLIC